MSEASANGGPVTVSLSRRVVPGKEAAYEAWVRGITGEAVTFPGHMGVNVIRPTAASSEYITIFRFDNYQHSREWEESDVRAVWLDRLEGLVEGETAVEKGTGLEFWFSLPELPVAHPSPHKMALVLLVVVYVLVLALNYLLNPMTVDWPGPARILLVALLQVLLMTYVVMPRVTRLLKGWLFAG